MRRSYPEPPGRGGGRRGAGFSGRVAPGPLPRTGLRNWGPNFPNCSAPGAVPLRHLQDSTHITRNSHTAPRASCRLTQLRCWVVPGRDSSSSASSGSRVPSLHSKVEFTCLLFLQALCPFCPAPGPRFASGRARQKLHRAFRAGRKRPFRPLAQQELAVSRPQRRAMRFALSLRGPRPAISPCAGGHPQCKAFGQDLITSRQPCSGPFRPRRRRESSHPARLRPFLPAEDTLRRHAPLRSAPLVTGRL